MQVLETNFIVLVQSQDIEHNLQNSVICIFIVPIVDNCYGSLPSEKCMHLRILLQVNGVSMSTSFSLYDYGSSLSYPH